MAGVNIRVKLLCAKVTNTACGPRGWPLLVSPTALDLEAPSKPCPAVPAAKPMAVVASVSCDDESTTDPTRSH